MLLLRLPLTPLILAFAGKKRVRISRHVLKSPELAINRVVLSGFLRKKHFYFDFSAKNRRIMHFCAFLICFLVRFWV